MPGIAWTRERLLQAAEFRPVDDLKLAVKRTRQALSARKPKVSVTKGDMTWESGGEPDHALRLQAADRIFDLADVRKPRNDGADPTRPVNVNILIGDRSAQALPARSGYVLELRPQPVVAAELSDHNAVDSAQRVTQQSLDLSQGCA